MNWRGAKNHVYRRITSLMMQRMQNEKDESQKPVSSSSNRHVHICELEPLTKPSVILFNGYSMPRERSRLKRLLGWRST